MTYSTLIIINGLKNLNKGDNRKAISIFSKVTQNPIKYYKSLVYSSRGAAYLNMGMYEDGLDDLLQSINIMKIPEGNMVSIARFFCMFKEYDRALKYISKAIKLKPKSSTINLYLGIIYYHKKEYEKSIEIFHEALQYKAIKSVRSQIYSNLADVYIQIKDFNKSINYIAKALDLDSKNAHAYTIYANLLRLQGDIFRAKENAKKAIEISLNQYLPYKILAEISLIEENHMDFYKNFKIYLDKKPISFGVDYESFKDLIYDRVRYKDEFKLLIKDNIEKTITLDNLKIEIDDVQLLKNNYKKNDTKVIQIISVSILILILILVSIFINFKLKESDNIKIVSPMDRVYAVHNINKNKVIKNSNKYTITWQTTNVKAGETVHFKVNGITETATKILTVEKYGDYLIGRDASANYDIGIDYFKPTNNKINTYIFIEPANETTVYEYDYILTESN
jgi:tetratricopeptide (TPR) repeat protein